VKRPRLPRRDPELGGIEAGGTKFVCAIGRGPGDLRAREEFPTTTPAETLARAAEFFRRRGGVESIGIACFGPVDLHPGSPTYGFITSTPKEGWRNVDVVGAIRKGTGVAAIGFDTDVNGAALAEARWGAARGVDSFIYLTVGTGIGGGAMIEGRLLHGRMHPEMGHIRIPRDAASDAFGGVCPWHGDCLEGLASGMAMRKRWGCPAEELPAGHPGWAMERHYLALGLVSFICTLSPRRIVVGGGVAQRLDFEGLREEVRRVLNGYLEEPDIVSPGLTGNAGVLGALALAGKVKA
jgi:fructokinase